MVIGSGPGGLQVSYCLQRLGIEHALLSADEAPGGMFRRFPFFQRLLSWTKPYAPAERDTRAYEWYDWNSLLADDPDHRAVMAGLMDGTSEFPTRPDMERNLATFVERTGLPVRYGCRWESSQREASAEGDRFVIVTDEGEYRARICVFAVGVAEAWTPPGPGMDQVPHYVDTRPAETYAGRRLFIIGKQNSGFELANGLLPWARSIVLASPRSATFSITNHSLAGIRARYLQPVEDFVVGGGVHVVNASIERVERRGDAFLVHTRRSENGQPLVVEADDVIAATGFQAPLRDLAALGVALFGQSRLPAQSPFWESATVPGIFFAGTITQGAAGLKKYGIPSSSGAVAGYRYNARVLAEQIAERHFGWQRPRPELEAAAVVPYLLDEATQAPELWNQRSYLARAISVEAGSGIRDEGIVPLAWFVDSSGPDALAVAVETDDRGDIHPAVYVRRAGRVDERLLESHPLLDFRTPGNRAQLEEIVRPLVA
ncbi:MAG: NAD(P)-binding domain-containing protein [Chloroflexi bacterium]|nr:NAD(P)-binding domain-containing protein [Chloroflexota bacterium]HEV8053727.1 NAD(P)-binding domain-containing protein [Candidatus Limnocylindrales bacterium]